MATVSREVMIESLVKDRFPNSMAPPVPASLANPQPGIEQSRRHQTYREQAIAYRLELSRLDNAALQEAYRPLVRKAAVAAELIRRLNEEKFAFNQARASADYDYWGKIAYWQLEEGTALLLGRSPEFASVKACNPCTQVSSFAHSYMRLYEMVKRAAAAQQISNPLIPGTFLAWAKRTNIDVPDDLLKAVEATTPLPDWKSLYDRLLELKTERDQLHESALAQAASERQTLTVRIEELEAMVASLRAGGANAGGAAMPPSDKGVGHREAETMRKLIIGMAVKGYAYAPNASRNSAVSDIAGDLAECGLAIDVDTVRSHLNKAAVLLPPDDAPERRPAPRKN